MQILQKCRYVMEFLVFIVLIKELAARMATAVFM